MKKIILALLMMLSTAAVCAGAEEDTNDTDKNLLKDMPATVTYVNDAGTTSTKTSVYTLTDGIIASDNYYELEKNNTPTTNYISPRFGFSFGDEPQTVKSIVIYAGEVDENTFFNAEKAKIPYGIYDAYNYIKIRYKASSSDTAWTEITTETSKAAKYNEVSIDQGAQKVTVNLNEAIKVAELEVIIRRGLGSDGDIADSAALGYRIKEIEAYASDNVLNPGEKLSAYTVTDVYPPAKDTSGLTYSQWTNYNEAEGYDNRLCDGTVTVSTGDAIWFVGYSEYKSQNGLPYVTLKYDAPVTFNNIIVYAGYGFDQFIDLDDVYIAYSNDNTVWKTVNLSNAKNSKSIIINGSVCQYGIFRLSFHTVTAQYVKLFIGKGTGNNESFRIREIEMYNDTSTNIENSFDAESQLSAELHNIEFDLSGGMVYAPAEGAVLKNAYFKGNEDNAKIILAIYEDGMLQNVKVAENSENIATEYNVNDNSIVKMFAWDEKIRPLVKNYTTSPDEKLTIFAFGDSAIGSWAQKLNFAESKVSINSDYSKERAITSSVVNDGTFDRLLTEVTEGDYVLLGFGLYDLTRSISKAAEPDPCRYSTYRYNLEGMIDNIRKHGAIPVLTTPLRNVKTGMDFAAYDAEIKAVADEKHVPLLDLKADAADEYYAEDQITLTEAGAEWAASLAAQAMNAVRLPIASALID